MLLAALRERGWTVGVAESLTGGLVAASLVEVPGASTTLRGGIIAYDERVKSTLLGVDGALLAEHGPVHPDVAAQMAGGVRRALAVEGRGPEVGIATTGIAGPDSPDGQPVGTVHIAVVTPRGLRMESEVLIGDRGRIRAETARRAVLLALSEVSIR